MLKDVDRLFSMRFIGPDLLSFTHFEHGRMTDQSRNTSNWERDDRLPEEHRFLQAVSRDARYALDYDTVDDVPHWSVYDYRSGRRLWDIPRCQVLPAFREDGKDVVGITASSSTPELVRWSSVDGQERLRVPLKIPAWDRLWISPNGKYLIGEHQIDDVRLPTTVHQWVGKLGVDWNPVLSAGYKFLTISDFGTGRCLGFCRVDSDLGDFRSRLSSSSLFLGASGIVILNDHGEAQFYPLPVQKDWKWLMCWSVVPSVGAGLLCAIRARNRRRLVAA
jgi:hypothetical protein